ncbi:rhomboid family intramembrane serine protease [Rhizobium sp. CF142]|uniref:rhomboid family intramembrane serine protease n=1 Tax=Rhizobium sp. CF142 TaxID=1144314 RepID=UPI00026F00BC|nr:rhomboid family intramembrane serine protease [Rhizobium sp. CF142]EJJ29210.1 putative membrane protein [Rhizobium sp. CF142]
MQPEELRRSEYAYKKGKLFIILLIFFAVAVGCILLCFNPPRGANLLAVYCFAALVVPFCGIVVLFLLSMLFSTKAGLVMSTAGLRLQIFPNQVVPWSAVRSFDRLRGKGFDNIVLHLDPIVAKSFTRRRLSPGSIGSRNQVGIPLKLLKGDPDEILDELIELASEAHEAERRARLEEEPIEPEDEVAAPEPAVNSPGRPLFTYALIGILVAVYVCELVFGVDMPKAGSPSTRTLLVLGGTFRPSIIADSEWWRLFTAPLLHGSPLHLAVNCISLWFAGGIFERLVGWRWFAAIFFISALGGSIVSVWINPPDIVGVGASGGIVGLFAAVIAVSIRFRSTPLAQPLQMGAIQILVPSLLPIIFGAKNGEHIDYAGHLGGALAGAALALLLVVFWPRERPNPRFGAAAVAFSALFVIVAVLSLWPISNLRQFMVDDPMANYFAGNYQRAATGFAASAAEDTKVAPYYNIWRFLAQSRGNDIKATEDLVVAAHQMDQSTWPYPVYSLFLGELNPDELMAKAGDDNQRCEAAFYNGEWYLFGGIVQEARQHFETALSTCPKTYMEYSGAQGELGKLNAR